MKFIRNYNHFHSKGNKHFSKIFEQILYLFKRKTTVNNKSHLKFSLGLIYKL
jgi:hypothetical protein